MEWPGDGGMRLFGWPKGSRGDARSAPVEAWRRRWAEAIDAPEGTAASLREQLEGLTASGVDLEVEFEMLDALEQLREAQRAAAGPLPIVETQHRVVGAEACHFTAPAALPSDEQQASGRLLLTSGRAIFVGGGRTASTPWHAVHQIQRADRDVLLVRPDRAAAAHFRFNTYGDAVLCAFIAGRLARAR